MSKQNDRQASVRDETGTAYSYNDDWMALFRQNGITDGGFNDRMVQWINAEIGASFGNINDAMKAFAVAQGFTSWNEMGAFIMAKITGQISVNDSTGIVAPSGMSLGATSAALVANRLYALPLVVSASQTFDAAGIVLTVVGAGSLRLGIRNATAAAPHGADLVADFGEIDVSTGAATLKEITGLALDLTPNLYVVNIVTDVVCNIAHFAYTTVFPIYGFSNNTGGFLPQTLAYRAFTYGALPADESGETYTYATATNPPAVRLTT